VSKLAEALARSPGYEFLLEEKRQTRKNDQAKKPLQVYRDEELQQMWQNFFGADQRYHRARQNFVYKGRIPVREQGDADFERRNGGRRVVTRNQAIDERRVPGGCAECAAGLENIVHDGGKKARADSGRR